MHVNFRPQPHCESDAARAQPRPFGWRSAHPEPERHRRAAARAVAADLLGIMVWYASVDGGFQYKHSEQWDATTSQDAVAGYKAAMALFRQGGAVPRIYY